MPNLVQRILEHCVGLIDVHIGNVIKIMDFLSSFLDASVVWFGLAVRYFFPLFRRRPCKFAVGKGSIGIFESLRNEIKSTLPRI